MNDGRQGPEQHSGMIALERKTAADQEEVAAAVAGRDAVDSLIIDRGRLDRGQCEVRREEERTAAREQEAVAGFDPSRIRLPIDLDPTGAVHDGVELDAFMRGKANRPLTTGVKASADRTFRLQKRQNIGQWVQGKNPDDREGKADYTTWIVRVPRVIIPESKRAGETAPLGETP